MSEILFLLANLVIIFYGFNNKLLFRTQGGVVKKAGGEVTSPVLMWVKALDLVLTQLQLDGVDFSAIKSVSGTAQVYTNLHIFFYLYKFIFSNMDRYTGRRELKTS